MSPEKQIRSQIEARIIEKCPQIQANDILSFFESRTPDVSGAGLEEEHTLAGMMKCEVRVLITTATKTDLDLSAVFFDWLRLPVIKVETWPEEFQTVEVKLARCACDLEKDHFKQENLWFEVIYPVFENGEPEEVPETVIDEGEIMPPEIGNLENLGCSGNLGSGDNAL